MLGIFSLAFGLSTVYFGGGSLWLLNGVDTDLRVYVGAVMVIPTVPLSS